MRMNTASEKVLRRRSARGPTLLYDLRFRRNTVHCVAKFGSLLGLHALKTPLPGSKHVQQHLQMDSSTRQIATFFQSCKYKGRRRAVGAKLAYYVFDVREAKNEPSSYMGPKPCLSFRLFRSSKRCTNEKVKARRVLIRPVLF